jgi:glycosyltransferase involved in cell wall biosynthesis
MLPSDVSMRICYALLYYDSARIVDPPVRSLDRELMPRHLPLAMKQRGHAVDVVHLYPLPSTIDDSGIRHQFVRSRWWARAAATVSHRLAGVEPARAEPATAAIHRILENPPDVIHLFGANLTLNTWLLVRAAATRIPVVVAHHGGNPPPGRLGRMLLRHSFSRVAAMIVTTADHARPFIEAGLIDGGHPPVSEIMEVSTPFAHRDRLSARRETGMRGGPVFLWAGRLEPVKDPLTALRGFDLVRRSRPTARLYLHYLTEGLLPEVRAFVHGQPGLAECVSFCGRLEHEAMEAVFNSADFLLQASRPLRPGGIAEFSGYVPLEAMACGVVPVLSDIPAFRAMTDGGRFGRLFPCGDHAALARAVLGLSEADTAVLGREVRDHFERELSFQAMARKLEVAYRQACRYHSLRRNDIR